MTTDITQPPGTQSPRLDPPLPTDIVVDAVYQDGVIKPLTPLDLPADTPLHVRISTQWSGSSDVAPQLVPESTRPTPRMGWTGGLGATIAQPLAQRGLLATFTRIDLILLLLGVLIYGVTRFTGLAMFPIYFFCDEAIQANLAGDLLRNGFRDASGTLLPPYFLNAEKWNLSLSVYIHTLGVALLGKSVEVTRGVSVIVSMLGIVAVALTLKLIFENRFWWLSALVLTAIPAWFLHSRTAFETVMMVAFYACFLCCYLLYRYWSPRYLFAALIFGGATFYSYANGQGVMLISGVLLLLSDLRYHLSQRRGIMIGALLLIALLAVPFVRFRFLQPEAIEGQLQALYSYWVQPIPLSEKLITFGQTYLMGLSPTYWFLPNDIDLSRHMMKGMGHAPLLLLPFVLIGLGVCIREWRSPAHRVVLIAILAAPFSAALVAVAITRVLAMVVPLTLLACIGLNQVYIWLRRWVAYVPFAVTSALVLTLFSFAMLRSALIDGPTWYTNYGLGGMQYGAEQLFAEAIPEELAKSPETRLLVSPTWANNPNSFLEFFLSPAQRSRIEMLNIDAFSVARRDLSLNQLFVMPDYEYKEAQQSGKFIIQAPERIIPYPDGRPGFYFVRMEYVPNIDEIFAADRAARQQLRETSATLNGQTVMVRHSLLDMGGIGDLFDTNPNTLIRGFEANPLVLEFNFSTPQSISAIGLTVGTMDFEVSIEATPSDGSPPRSYTTSYVGQPPDPAVEYTLPDGTLTVTKLRLAIRNLNEGEVAHIHVRDVTFR